MSIARNVMRTYIYKSTKKINIYTFILERSACSVKHPCALSALELFLCDFSAARHRFVARLARSDSPQSRGPCPRIRPRRGRRAALARWQGRVSAVSHTRPNHSPVSLQRPVCWGPPTVPRSRSFFFWSQSLVLDRHGLGAAAAAACCCCCPQHQY